MDDTWKQSLDSYITSGRYRRWTEELECKNCGRRWIAMLEQEYGITTYVMDDNLCPECGADYEEDN